MADLGGDHPVEHPVSDVQPKIEPQVERPVIRGMRWPFGVALTASLVLISVAVWKSRTAASPLGGDPHAVPAGCTSLEVEETIRAAAMTDADRITCLAVAGKIDRARTMLRAMPDDQRMQAMARVFAVAHPIADRGDDASAGPIMWLVVEFWPENYMAVFHAGMSDFALGRDDAARTQLENFLQMYSPHDVWRARAIQALEAIASHTPLDRREAHFPE